MVADLTPYSTAKKLMGVLPSWLPPSDAERFQAYAVYESLYRNVPEAFKLVQRGSDANPVYIPNARTIVEATNRFLCKGWTFALDPTLGTDADRAGLGAMLRNMFRREQMWTKFASQKRWGLIRGDAVWHIVADETKPEGKRVSVYELDPAEYFPIFDVEDNDRRVGCHLVTQYAAGDAVVIRRQTYRKQEDGTISYELTWWETGAWDDRPNSGQELKKVPPPEGEEEIAPITLPPTITSIPVYHVKNNRVPGQPFGGSELSGLELLIASVNQTISDEEFTLVLQGLGVYATTSGPPVNDAGEEVNWRISPGWVVEIDEGSEFERINGVGSVQPMQDHIAYMERKMLESAGIPDIAVGTVDTGVAESGVALAMKMSPLIAKNEEKEQEILGVMDHLLYDLSTMWLPAFEGTPVTEAQAVSVVEDAMPTNRKQVIDEVIALVAAELMSREYAVQYLSEKLGFEFPDTMLDAVVSEQTALAEARNSDPFTARIARELDSEQ